MNDIVVKPRSIRKRQQRPSIDVISRPSAKNVDGSDDESEHSDKNDSPLTLKAIMDGVYDYRYYIGAALVAIVIILILVYLWSTRKDSICAALGIGDASPGSNADPPAKLPPTALPPQSTPPTAPMQALPPQPLVWAQQQPVVAPRVIEQQPQAQQSQTPPMTAEEQLAMVQTRLHAYPQMQKTDEEILQLIRDEPAQPGSPGSPGSTGQPGSLVQSGSSIVDNNVDLPVEPLEVT